MSASPLEAGQPTDDELWRLETVTAKTGLGKSMIYRKLHAGTFPRPRRLGDRAVAWLRSDVVQWMHALPVASTQEAIGVRADSIR